MDNWLEKNSWLVSLELVYLKSGQKAIKMQIASLNPEFTKKQQTDFNFLFQNKKIDIKKKKKQRNGKQKVYFFDILVN